MFEGQYPRSFVILEEKSPRAFEIFEGKSPRSFVMFEGKSPKAFVMFEGKSPRSYSDTHWGKGKGRREGGKGEAKDGHSWSTLEAR